MVENPASSRAQNSSKIIGNEYRAVNCNGIECSVHVEASQDLLESLLWFEKFL